MKAVILARVSTEEQKREGHSIPAQVRRQQDYASRKDLEVIKTFQFDESATKNVRKTFDEVVEFLRAFPEPLALLTDAADRVQRDFRATIPLDELRRAGKIEIHFSRENLIISQQSNNSEIMRWDMAVMFAKNYALTISDNVKRANEQKIRNGEWTGKAPLGYLNITDPETGKKAIKLDPARARHIKEAFELCASGNYSLDQIRMFLEEDGMVNKTTSRPLTRSQLHKILHNPFYYGEMRVKGKLHQHNYEPIVERWLFDKVQAVLEGRHKQPVKLQSKPFVFKGILKCAFCGCAVSFELKKGRYVYGRCTKYRGNCPGVRVKEEALVKQVQNLFGSMHIPSKVLGEVKDTLQSSHEAKKHYHEEALEKLRKEYDSVQGRQDKLLDLLINDDISKETFEAKTAELKKRQREIDELLSKHTDADEQFTVTATSILDLASRAGELFASSKPDQKRQLLSFVLSNLRLDGEKLVYELNKPFDAILSASKRSQWLGDRDSNPGCQDQNLVSYH